MCLDLLFILWNISIILSHNSWNRVPCIDRSSLLCKRWSISDWKQSMMGMFRSGNQWIHYQRGITETCREMKRAITRGITKKRNISVNTIIVYQRSSRCEWHLLECSWMSRSVVVGVAEIFLILFIHLRRLRWLLWKLSSSVHDIFEHGFFGTLRCINIHRSWFIMLSRLNFL